MSEMSYEVAVNSGIDLVIKRSSGRTVTYLVLIMSQKQYYTKDEKTGTITALSGDSLLSYWSGLPTGADYFTEHSVFNQFQRNKKYCAGFMAALADNDFAVLAKAGVTNIGDWISMESSYYFNTYRCEEITVRDNLNCRKTIHVNSTLTLYEKNVSFIRWMLDNYCTLANCHGGINIFSSHNNAKLNERSIQDYIILKNIFGIQNARAMFTVWAANDLYTDMPNPSTLIRLFMCCKKRNNDDVNGYPSEYYQKMAMEGCTPRVVFAAKEFSAYMFETALQSGFADQLDNWAQTWADVLAMQQEVFDEVEHKYPKDLLAQHALLGYKERVRTAYIDAEKWKSAAENAKAYEGSTTVKQTGWSLIAPKETADIIDEATQQSNCVASYVGRMSRGECTIMFLRKTALPNHSCCTVEIHNGTVVQFREHFNRNPTSEEREAMHNICEKVGINFRG